MVPPALLGTRAGERVLDLCAAPGSKASQLLDDLVAGSDPEGAESDSLLVCNESEPKRMRRLSSRLRLQPSAPLLLVTSDAARFPDLQVALHPERSRSEMASLRFHKVLCDVPCSGDGTTRKNADIWGTWRAERGLDLHPKQCAILRRGLRLLEPGGLLAYSTCSLNPLENEAVVAEALRQQPAGEYELVEPPALPGLRVSEGRLSWSVPGAAGEGAKRMRPSLFPPAASEDFDLRRCVRLLPHHNDSNGFFCALVRRRGRPAPASMWLAEPGTAALPRDARDGVGLPAEPRDGPGLSGVHAAFPPVEPASPERSELAAFFGLEADAPGLRRFPWELAAMPRSVTGLGPRMLVLLPCRSLQGLQLTPRLHVTAGGPCSSERQSQPEESQSEPEESQSGSFRRSHHAIHIRPVCRYLPFNTVPPIPDRRVVLVIRPRRLLTRGLISNCSRTAPLHTHGRRPCMARQRAVEAVPRGHSETGPMLQTPHTHTHKGELRTSPSHVLAPSSHRQVQLCPRMRRYCCTLADPRGMPLLLRCASRRVWRLPGPLFTRLLRRGQMWVEVAEELPPPLAKDAAFHSGGSQDPTVSHIHLTLPGRLLSNPTTITLR